MNERDLSTRREFLQGVKRWSGAVATMALTGAAVVGTGPAASAWVNGTWANRAGGWVNRYGGGGAWVNGHGGWINGGGGWVNRAGGGSAGWVNRYGGGGAAWVNR